MKPICDLCGTRHESYQAHVFATNRNATNTSATNRAGRVSGAGAGGREAVRAGVGVAAVGVGEASGVRSVGAGERGDKTRNRRSRESYNAYQREYMRRRRALSGD